MLVIKVWCLPADQTEDELNKLHRALVGAAMRFPELGIRGEQDMLNLFPADLMKYGLGTEILIEVSGVPEESEDDWQVKRCLGNALADTVKKFYPEARVFCTVAAFNPSFVGVSSEG